MKSQSFLALSLAMLMCCSCREAQPEDQGNSSGKTTQTQITQLTKSQKEFVESNNAFAITLFREINNIYAGKNVLYSPFSIESVLSMLLNGTEGDTFSQIQAALSYEKHSVEEINELYAAIESILKQSGSSVRYLNANALWSNNMSPKENYIKTLKTYYDSELFYIDFSSTDAPVTINNWCSEQTEGMIDSIIDDLDPNDRFVFLNALFFEGSWRKKFDKSKTEESPFYNINGNASAMQFMHMDSDFSSTDIDGDKVCILPFGTGDYKFVIFLPSEEKDYQEFLSSFDEKQYKILLDALKIHNVNLSLPKIKIECELSDVLSRSLKALGITDAFDINSADFSKMLDEKTSLGIIKQKACFQMNEEGAKVASATMAGDAGEDSFEDPEIMEFNANRPFLFIINERITGTILLMGSFVS